MVIPLKLVVSKLVVESWIEKQEGSMSWCPVGQDDGGGANWSWQMTRWGLGMEHGGGNLSIHQP